MINKPKTPCAGCSKKRTVGGCVTSDSTSGCPGESWKCLLKKWHFVGILALITGFGSKIPDRMIDSLFPPDKEKTEEPASQQKDFKIITVLGRLENGEEIAIIKSSSPQKEEALTPELKPTFPVPPSPKYISTPSLSAPPKNTNLRE